MTFLDQVVVDGSTERAAAWARGTGAQLRTLSRDRSAIDVVFSIAATDPKVFSQQDLDLLLAPYTPPLGIYGTGLYFNGETWVPALFVMPELVEGARTDAIEVVHARSGVPAVTVLRRLGVSPPPDGFVVTLPLPVEELGIGVDCDVPGTLGIPVWLEDGHKGVLTAGHVGRPVGAEATVDGRPIGHVTYTNHRKLHRSPEASADVAVIDLSADGVRIVETPPYVRTGVAVKLGRARAVSRSNTNPGGDLVRAVHETVAIDEDGEWADVAMVDEGISVRGDSGSAVINDANEVIGQIVGGHPPTYSFVQNAELLLSDSKTSFRK
jgi:hypothetical protein